MLKLSAEDCFLSMMPLFHLTGLLSSLAQILAGGSVVATSGFDASMFVNWMGQFHPSWYTATPAVHNAILPLVETRRFRLRFVRSIGAALPQTLLVNLEKALGVPVLEGYGMTEAGMVTSNEPPPQKRKSGSVGRSAGVEVAILGGGEIGVRGPAVIQGYLNNPDADRSAFRDGWLLTGDVGHLDEEGFLFVTGRIKDIINRGGEKVLPAEIDEVLSAHPSVQEAMAFGIAHPTLGEDVAAAVVLIPGASVGVAELRRFAALSLADFKVPRRIVSLDAIPKGATGKAQRVELAKWFEREASLQAISTEPLTPVERKLQTICQRILRVENVGVDDDFFSLGGDSLALTLLMAEVEFEFGVDAAGGSEFFSSPTIKTLAEAIATLTPSGGGRSAVLALQPLGSEVPFFCIPGSDENPYHFSDLARAMGKDQPFYVLRDPRPLEERGSYSLEEHAAQFASALRSALPGGPYLLGGHCYGGIVAFEVARQLVAAGEDVGLLALFEVPAPGYPKVVRNWRNYVVQSTRLVRALARGEEHATWEQAREHVRVLRRILKRKKQALTWRGSFAMGLAPDKLPERLTSRNIRAGRSYDPKPLCCNVVHFIAADEQHSTLVLDDPRLGWRDQVGEGFSVQRVPGRADAIFKEPNATELARQLRALLDGIHARLT
jgi:thioesterase domain-containing protein/acyl carrier protein